MIAVPLTNDENEGRWRWRSNRPVPLSTLPRPPSLSPFANYDGIIKCPGLHIQNQWLRTFDVRIAVGGISLLPHQTPGFPVRREKRVDVESYGRRKFHGRHFKQPQLSLPINSLLERLFYFCSTSCVRFRVIPTFFLNFKTRGSHSTGNHIELWCKR